MKIYMVEVGVELPKDDIQYDNYRVDLNNKSWQALYDENVCAFQDQEKAKKYIDEYVENGVPNTYGFMWEIEKELDDFDLENLKFGYLEDVIYDGDDVLYFKGGL